MNIIYSKQAVKALERLNASTKQRIKQGILNLPEGDTTRLKGHTELNRLRVGEWRVVYSQPSNDTILIEKIAPRGDVYKGV